MVGMRVRRGVVCTAVRSWHCLRQEAIGCKRPPPHRSPPSAYSSPSPSSSSSLSTPQRSGHVVLRCEAGEAIVPLLGSPHVANAVNRSSVSWNRLPWTDRPGCARGTCPLARAAREFPSSVRSYVARDVQRLLARPVPSNLVVGPTNATIATSAVVNRTASNGLVSISSSASLSPSSSWGIRGRYISREVVASPSVASSAGMMTRVVDLSSSISNKLLLCSTKKSAGLSLRVTGGGGGGGIGGIGGHVPRSGPTQGAVSRRHVVTDASAVAGEVPRGLGGSGLSITRSGLRQGRGGGVGLREGMESEKKRPYSTGSWTERVKATMERVFGPRDPKGTSSSSSSVIPGATERTKKAMESLSKNPPSVPEPLPARSQTSLSPLSRQAPSPVGVGGRAVANAIKNRSPSALVAKRGGLPDKALRVIKGWGMAPVKAVKDAGLKYRQAVALQVEGFWKRNYLILVGAGGVAACLLLWRVMFGIASIFVNFSERMASAGFLALAAAIVTFGGLGLRRAYTINPDVVYRRAMRMINTSPAVLEVMGAPLTGTDVRAYVMSGGGLRLKNFKPKITTKRVYLIFPVRGAERRGLVSVEAKKRKGKYVFKLLAVDVPTAGAEQRLFLLGDDTKYKSGGGLIAELRDPIVTAMRAQKEFEEEDDKEEEEEERQRKAEQKRLAEEQAQKLKEDAEAEARLIQEGKKP